MVGRGSPLNGRLVDGGTDGSNPSPSSGESGANLTLEAIPSVAVAKCGPSSGDTSMPQDAERALPILERAIALEPDYAVAHAIIAWCHEQRPCRLANAANGTPSLPRSVALNRRALISSLTSRASGFAVANGSVPAINILIARPQRCNRIGKDKI